MTEWKCREIESQKFYAFRSSSGERRTARVVSGRFDRRFIRPVFLGLSTPARVRNLRFPVKFTCPKRAMNTVNEGPTRYFLKVAIEGRPGTNPCFLKFSKNQGPIPASLVQALNRLTHHLRSTKDGEEDDPASGSESVRSGEPSSESRQYSSGQAPSVGRRAPVQLPPKFRRKRRKK